MTRILVGIDGTIRGERALAWSLFEAAHFRGQRGKDADSSEAAVTLLSVVDPSILRVTGLTAEVVHQSTTNLLRRLREEALQQYPDLEIDTRIVEGSFIEAFAQTAPGHDLIVLGSHHGATLAEAVGGAKGLRLSTVAPVPVVVVPADWEPTPDRAGVIVGIGPDEVSEAAVAFAAVEAHARQEPLTLVAVWGIPALLSGPAEVLGGGLEPVRVEFTRQLDQRAAGLREVHPDLDVRVQVIEGAPARTLSEVAWGAALLVLGTHRRGAVGRALFGSVTHGVLSRLQVPTVVVPQQ